MRYDRPRFRQDLLAELVDEQGARFIDVMDPESGNLFRFYEVEYSLACAMDGERDVPGIVKWAQEELGLSPSFQEVRSVIATLGDLGFIDTGAADLAPGVVVGSQARAQPSASLELGTAGVSATTSQPLPRAPEYALGASGVASRRSAEHAEDVPLGAPGRGSRTTPSPPVGGSDVSIDLSDHIAVRPADVQEAVRASKVMAAVDVPASLMDTIEDRPTARAAQPQVLRPAERLEPKAEIRVGKAPLTRQPQATKPPVELPRPPVPVDQPGPVPTPPRPARVSPVLVILLILVALGAGAFLVWKYVLEKPAGDATATVEPAPLPATPATPPPPAPPPPPTAKIAMEVPEPDDVKSVRAGMIETILADKAAVKTGDVIVKLVGNKPIEAELSALSRDQKKLQDQIDAATKRRDVARTAGQKGAENAAQTEIEARQKVLGTKQRQLAEKTVELDKFLIHAPNNGTFAPAVKLGQKIAADDVVATIQRDAIPTATFKVADTRSFAANASVELAVGKGELRVSCTVAEVQPENQAVKVTCPVDPALAAATDVTLKLPVATAPAAPAPPGTSTPGEPGTPAPASTPPPAPGTAPPSGTAPPTPATPTVPAAAPVAPATAPASEAPAQPVGSAQPAAPK